MVEVWILLERRLLPWCVAGVQSRFSTAWYGRKSRRTSTNCVLKRSRESRRLQLYPEQRKNSVGRLVGQSLIEVDLELWKGINPYRKFDGNQLALFKPEKFSWRTDNASEGYILGTEIATSAMLPLLVLSLATMLLSISFSLFRKS